MNSLCKSIGCVNKPAASDDFCEACRTRDLFTEDDSLLTRYPDNYREVGDTAQIDTFAVFNMFQLQDSSGCLQMASQKLLLSGPSKTRYRDIREARDILTRWLQLNPGLNQ